MAKHSDGQTVIRLNRLFLLGNAEYRKAFVFVVAAFGLLPLVVLLCCGALAWWNLLLIVLLDTVICVTLALEYPRVLWLRAGTLEFNERFTVGRGSSVRAMVTLTDLREVSFVQNPLEKKFGVARLCLTGTPSVEYTGLTREDKPMSSKTHYVFCGVRLDETLALLEAELPERAFKQ